MKIITIGGWYQRTTMHLTEVYSFLTTGKSRLELSQDELSRLRKNLDIKSLDRKQSYLEYIEIVTREKIRIKYYEDGLYLLSMEHNDVVSAKKKVKEYFFKRFKPAMDYLFSLGAPTPRILANIKEDPPVVVGEIKTPASIKRISESVYGRVYSETNSKDVYVFKTNDYIIVQVSRVKKDELYNLLEMQLFFREFKQQLHKYLDIHRKVWEEISDIKEKKVIRGKDVEKYRAMLDSYQKTIRLIGNRINQMSTYAKTRASLAKELKVKERLVALFKYKFEDLFSSLEYIKEIWKMTSDYVDSAIQIMVEIAHKADAKGIKSIQLLVSVGVIAGIIRILKPGNLPILNLETIGFLIGLGILAFGADWILKRNASNKKYKLKFVERSKDL